MKSFFLRLCYASLSLFALNLPASSIAATKSPNIIGFFQSYDDTFTPAGTNEWYFNTQDTPLSSSGYTVLIDAFWVNYPYCWGNGSCIPGQGNPIKACCGISNAPGPGNSYEIDKNFWGGNYTGVQAPAQPGTTYTNYWTSLHTTGPQTMFKLKNEILNKKAPVKLLASIGGWNMGGSASGCPNTPKLPQQPAWKAMLTPTKTGAIPLTTAMSEILSIKILEADGSSAALYDGIDIDMETLFAAGCTGDLTSNSCTNGVSKACLASDVQNTINNTVKAIEDFRKTNKTATLSISPRASDIYCKQSNCTWHDKSGYGFIGKILKQLAQDKVYFNFINPQFYNDQESRNIPNNSTSGYSKPTIGEDVPDILKALYGIVGSSSEINIGVLAQTATGQADRGVASSDGNPGVPMHMVKPLWDLLQTDPGIKNTGITISGIMTWAANLDLTKTALSGHVRSVKSGLASSTKSIVYYNWGSKINPNVLTTAKTANKTQKQSLWSRLSSAIRGAF
ncbi:MAG: hypothetical protein P1U63_11320 [Coxiellaceae bacterium]|nr:hypothetical protein [Coxiellaceae bacterium]